MAAWLPSLGGYGEYALAAAWTPKPPNVTWNDAGALPASVEAAVGVLRQLGVAEGETLLILGAGGSVGIIATQLAIRQGLKVIGAVGARDEALIRELGAIPVALRRQPALERPRGHRPSRCDLRRRGQRRTRRRHHAHRRRRPRDHAGGRARGGARRSVLGRRRPIGLPTRVEIGMRLLASGELRLRSQQSLPMSAAAEAHRLLENGHAHHKLLLTTDQSSRRSRNDNDSLRSSQ